MNYFLPITLILLMSLLITGVKADEMRFHSHADIEQQVAAFIQSKLTTSSSLEIEIRVDSLDKRLRLAHCEPGINTFLPHSTRINSRVSVGVECEGKKPWKLYVPVSIARYATLYMANNALMKGDKIRKEDLKQVRMDISKLRVRPISEADEIVGKLASRNIARGVPFSARYLKLPTIVKKGDSVNIIASMSGLDIQMTGKAMTPGAKGQRIRVINSSSKRTVEAVVVNAHTVKVSL